MTTAVKASAARNWCRGDAAMKWRKLGRVYFADGRHGWDKQGAMVPTPYMRADGTVRIFIGCTDENNVGRIGYVDVDGGDPTRVIRVAEKPVLDVGRAGCFDDNGVLPLSIVRDGNVVYLYYVGFQLGTRVRFFMFCGRAESHDGGETFVRSQEVPVLDRTDGERFSRAGAFVRKDPDGIWRAWYLSGNDWNDVHGKAVPEYHLRYVESSDGLHFGRAGKELLSLSRPDEYAFARPFVVAPRTSGEPHRMYYSIRSKSRGYRLGYAESGDGMTWQRRDSDLGLDVSPSGWDSEDMCWSSYLDIGGRHYLFYNGNKFGRDGFGVAELESE